MSIIANSLEEFDSFSLGYNMEKCGCESCEQLFYSQLHQYHLFNVQQLQLQIQRQSSSYSYTTLKTSPNLLSFLVVDNSFFSPWNRSSKQYMMRFEDGASFFENFDDFKDVLDTNKWNPKILPEKKT